VYGSLVHLGTPPAPESEIVGGCACCVTTASAVAGTSKKMAVAMMNRYMTDLRVGYSPR
jgi:hypothetical protein